MYIGSPWTPSRTSPIALARPGWKRWLKPTLTRRPAASRGGGDPVDLVDGASGRLLDQHVGAGGERLAGRVREGVVGRRHDHHVRRGGEHGVDVRHRRGAEIGGQLGRPAGIDVAEGHDPVRRRGPGRACGPSARSRRCRRAGPCRSHVLLAEAALEVEAEPDLGGVGAGHRLAHPSRARASRRAGTRRRRRRPACRRWRRWRAPARTARRPCRCSSPAIGARLLTQCSCMRSA